MRVVFLELSKIKDQNGDVVDGIIVSTVPRDLQTPDDWKDALEEIITTHVRGFDAKEATPLDMKFDKPSRIAFHVDIPGWRFQEGKGGFQVKGRSPNPDDTFRDSRLFPVPGKPNRTTAVVHNDLVRGNAVVGANNRWQRRYVYELLLEIPTAYAGIEGSKTFPLPTVLDPDIENEGED